MQAKTETVSSNLSHLSVIRLLKTLSKNEIRQFDKFVRSPFHNNRSEVTRYFQLLKKYHPAYDHKNFYKEKVYKKLYPGKSYKDDVMRRLNSNLLKIAEDYIVISGLDRNKYPFSIRSLDFKSHHGLDDLFMKSYSKIISGFHSEKVSNNTFLQKWIYENSYVHHNSSMSRYSEIMSNVVNSGIYHILHFFAHLPAHYDDIVYHKKLHNYEPAQNLIEKFLLNFNFEKFLKGIDYSQNEYLKFLPLYIYQFLICRYPDKDEYYFHFKTEILKLRSLLSDKEIHYSWSFLLGYCIVKFQNGSCKYLDEFHELSKLAVEENLMTYHKYIAFDWFYCIVDLNLIAHKIDFVENFISEYGGRIAPDSNKATLNLSRARLLFEKRDFAKALDKLNKVKYVHPPLQSWVKFLLAKIYYEMSYTEMLISHVDTFRRYIKINKYISEEVRSRYMRFLSYLTKLNKLKTYPDPAELHGIKQSLLHKNNKMDCGYKSWLLEKAVELESKAASKDQRTLSSTKSPYQKSKIG